MAVRVYPFERKRLSDFPDDHSFCDYIIFARNTTDEYVHRFCRLDPIETTMTRQVNVGIVEEFGELFREMCDRLHSRIRNHILLTQPLPRIYRQHKKNLLDDFKGFIEMLNTLERKIAMIEANVAAMRAH